MPNSNPPCNPKTDLPCDPTYLEILAETYHEICLNSGLEPDPVTLFAVGGTSGLWEAVSGFYNYRVFCVSEGVWGISWDALPPVIDYGEEKTTGDTFPNLSFSNFSTSGGSC